MKPNVMPTADEIHVAYKQGEAAVRALFERQSRRLQELEARLQALEDQLAKNSQNSSKPPSRDGLKKPKTKSLRQPSGKRSGGQKGHTGYRLEPVAKPRHVEKHGVVTCQHCEADLSKVAQSGRKAAGV